MKAKVTIVLEFNIDDPGISVRDNAKVCAATMADAARESCMERRETKIISCTCEYTEVLNIKC